MFNVCLKTGHKKSLNEFCSSHVSLIGASICDNTQLRIIWRCGKLEQSQICAIKMFAIHTGKSLGFDNLFPICLLKKIKYIKVIFNILNKSQYKSATQMSYKASPILQNLSIKFSKSSDLNTSVNKSIDSSGLCNKSSNLNSLVNKSINSNRSCNQSSHLNAQKKNCNQL